MIDFCAVYKFSYSIESLTNKKKHVTWSRMSSQLLHQKSNPKLFAFSYQSFPQHQGNLVNNRMFINFDDERLLCSLVSTWEELSFRRFSFSFRRFFCSLILLKLMSLQIEFFVDIRLIHCLSFVFAGRSNFMMAAAPMLTGQSSQ